MASPQPRQPGRARSDAWSQSLAALGERLRGNAMTGEDWASWLHQVSHSTASPLGAIPPGTTTGEVLEWLARRAGFAIERKPAPDNGRTIWEQRLIWVSPESDDEATARAVLHQLGHITAALHAGVPGTVPACRGVRKAEADSIAYIVSARLGLDTASYSFAAPELWAGRDARAHPEATILGAANRIVPRSAEASAGK